MNYAFHIDLGHMAYETCYEMYTKPENAAKRGCQWGPEHIGKSGPSSVVMLPQVNDEEKLTTHMKFATEMAATMGMRHEIYKLTPDSR